MKRSLALAMFLASILVSACGTAAGTANPCADSPDWAGTMCPDAIAVANARLGLIHWPVTSTRFLTSLCPPNARCAAEIVPHATWVIFTFSVGDPVMIQVGPPDALVAGDPGAPPDWILEELGQAP